MQVKKKPRYAIVAALRTDFPACIVMSAGRAGDVSLLREAMTGLCEQFGQM